ncbi:PREDICTED: uncharacterized protein LOC18611294 isoform X1 [Theobroma cacao]|uniref:Uncharacterized protein LOC18611294 isoform X1 n=2 Tax=Theobroma cacao TaxID=3641 RepID=A0AB32VZR7_THECC|nr:PREDICTED: uncharacterized protein LOC18611294 isoform X1 [Theobroma cacao]
MSEPNGAVASLIFLLVFSSMFSPKLVVFGSALHEHSFKRPDPLRHLKDYRGVYNVTDTHYWASAAFTGVHGYAMAGVWTLCGICFGIFLIFKNISSSESSSSSSSFTDHLDRYYLLLFMMFLLLTLLAIVAASFVIAANQRSLQRIKKLKNTIVSAGDDVSKSIRRLITAMTRIQYLLLPYDRKTSQELNVTTHRLGKESRTIQNFVRSHERPIDVAIQTSYVAHLVIAMVNLLLLIAALVLLLSHWHPGLIFIICFCWILTALCWVLTGFDFSLHTFAQDSCSAFEDYVQDPQNNILSSILPCMNSTNSDEILTGIGSTVHDFIGELNLQITEVYSRIKLNEQNDGLFGFGMICDPFSGAPNYSYVPEVCPEDAIPIGSIPDILSRFTCYNENSTQVCSRNGKILPEDTYNEASAYSHSVQYMLNVFPDLQNLAECSMVKDAFSDVFLHQCRPFRTSLRWLWASMLSLSISMMLLELTWIVKAFQEKGRCFSRCSIFPRQSNPL